MSLAQKDLYLLAYNLFLFGLWSAMLVVYFGSGMNPEKVFATLVVAQTAAVLEVVHAQLGIVRSSVKTTAMQVYSRLMVTWAVFYAFPDVRSMPGFHLCIIAWSISEIVRYSFYACSIVDGLPYAIKWMRYSFFIVLYPVGVTGELMSMYAASQLATAPVVGYFVVSALLYIPAFPQLYFHMLGQRKKALASAARTKAE